MPSFSLERFVGAAAGDDAAFDGRETYTVGRKPSCNLVLSDSRVSGLHATFSKQEAGRIAVVDSSSNGTYLNGRLLDKGERAVLGDGDVVALLKPRTQRYTPRYMYRCALSRAGAPAHASGTCWGLTLPLACKSGADWHPIGTAWRWPRKRVIQT